MILLQETYSSKQCCIQDLLDDNLRFLMLSQYQKWKRNIILNFLFTNNYGPLRAILHLPQVDSLSVEGATVCHCHSKWTWWISKVKNNFEAFFHKRWLFCHTWPKLLKSWVHRKQRKNSWHLHAFIHHLELIMFQVKVIHNILPLQSSLFDAHMLLIMKFILSLTLKINLLYTC